MFPFDNYNSAPALYPSALPGSVLYLRRIVSTHLEYIDKPSSWKTFNKAKISLKNYKNGHLFISIFFIFRMYIIE